MNNRKLKSAEFSSKSIAFPPLPARYPLILKHISGNHRPYDIFFLESAQLSGRS